MSSPTAIVSPIERLINDIYLRHRENHLGDVATYIPELGKANPDWFGICLVMADGAVYEAGDTAQAFTIQSISKPFTYGLALEDNGKKEVLDKIWMEPTGEAFNSISLQPGTGRPLNPMINAGAIAATGLIAGITAAQKINRIRDAFSRFAGRPLKVDETVYKSESDTGHRNRAIAHMLRNFDILTTEPTPTLEAYFMQCSLLVTCRDLAVMAATLANGGVNPLTQQRAVLGDYVENMLSVMSSCGMYDAAGEWVYQVGIPAKSGVAGGILAVLPGQLGIGVFSPRLDAHGNSVRGIEVCRELSRRLNLHMFNSAHPAKSVIRSVRSAGQVSSKRVRSREEQKLLLAHGARIRIIHLQGELQFATAERAIRQCLYEAQGAEQVLLSFKHVLAIDFAAIKLITELAVSIMGAKKSLIIAGVGHLRRLERAFKLPIPGPGSGLMPEITADEDQALEILENRLLHGLGALGAGGGLYGLENCELLTGLDAAAKNIVLPLFTECVFQSGELMVRAGDTDRSMFFILKGDADAFIELTEGRKLRVASFSPGVAFGEMALLDAAPRSASVVAVMDVVCAVLPEKNLKLLEESHPAVMVVILRNLASVLAQRLRTANNEIRAANSRE